jgi:hypothetical protein
MTVEIHTYSLDPEHVITALTIIIIIVTITTPVKPVQSQVLCAADFFRSRRLSCKPGPRILEQDLQEVAWLCADPTHQGEEKSSGTLN